MKCGVPRNWTLSIGIGRVTTSGSEWVSSVEYLKGHGDVGELTRVCDETCLKGIETSAVFILPQNYNQAYSGKFKAQNPCSALMKYRYGRREDWTHESRRNLRT